MSQVTIYTDGACKGNPGPGGFGAVLLSGKHRKEISAGYRLTTNNRMELLAAITALELLQSPCKVELHSDSKYLVQAINDRWILGWQKRGWINSKKEPVKNQDLWQRLIRAMQAHKITWKWVKGHAGNQENERCDELANEAVAGSGLLEDEGFPMTNDQ
ncbi:MAG: ribonuclease HI [Akkermansiaceae bacterium]|nr:ribonuclease HI [Akkermansiaceae bacterium]